MTEIYLYFRCMLCALDSEEFVLFQDPDTGAVEGISVGGDDTFTLEGSVTGGGKLSLCLHSHRARVHALVRYSRATETCATNYC